MTLRSRKLSRRVRKPLKRNSKKLSRKSKRKSKKLSRKSKRKSKKLSRISKRKSRKTKRVRMIGGGGRWVDDRWVGDDEEIVRLQTEEEKKQHYEEQSWLIFVWTPSMDQPTWKEPPRPFIIENWKKSDTVPINYGEKTDGWQLIEVLLSGDNTIEDVKEKIRSDTGITKDRLLSISFIMKALDRGDRTLEAYGILNDSRMIVKNMPPERTKIKIHVMTFGGKTFPLEVVGSDTILNVKHKIRGLDGGRAEAVRHLIYDKEMMDDSKTVADYNITTGSTVYVMISIERPT